MHFLEITKWPRIGGWLLIRVGAHSRFYSLLYCQLIYIAIFTLNKAIFWHFMLMLNTISPHEILLPELTLSYSLQINKMWYIDYLMSYIYINIAGFGKLVSYLNTITPYSENIASYCDWQYTENIYYNIQWCGLQLVQYYSIILLLK